MQVLLDELVAGEPEVEVPVPNLLSPFPSPVLREEWSAKPIARFLNLPRLHLLNCGSLFVFYTAAIYLAVDLAQDREQLLEIALVKYLWPALTILASVPLLKRQARPWLLPGTELALTGVFLVMMQGARVFRLVSVGHFRLKELFQATLWKS